MDLGSIEYSGDVRPGDTKPIGYFLLAMSRIQLSILAYFVISRCLTKRIVFGHYLLPLVLLLPIVPYRTSIPAKTMRADQPAASGRFSQSALSVITEYNKEPVQNVPRTTPLINLFIYLSPSICLNSMPTIHNTGENAKSASHASPGGSLFQTAFAKMSAHSNNAIAPPHERIIPRFLESHSFIYCTPSRSIVSKLKSTPVPQPIKRPAKYGFSRFHHFFASIYSSSKLALLVIFTVMVTNPASPPIKAIQQIKSNSNDPIVSTIGRNIKPKIKHTKASQNQTTDSVCHWSSNVFIYLPLSLLRLKMPNIMNSAAGIANRKTRLKASLGLTWQNEQVTPKTGSTDTICSPMNNKYRATPILIIYLSPSVSKLFLPKEINNIAAPKSKATDIIINGLSNVTSGRDTSKASSHASKRSNAAPIMQVLPLFTLFIYLPPKCISYIINYVERFVKCFGNYFQTIFKIPRFEGLVI